MAANEISERLAAACWVQCGSAGGEALNVLTNDQLRFRSHVGFKNQIITTLNAQAQPVLILPLDRVLSRTECAVFALRLDTVGPNASPLDRESYFNYPVPLANYPQVLCQPIHLDWLGPNLAAPTFYPFGLLPGPFTVPAGFDLNLFNALAVLLTATGGAGDAGDFCCLVLKHPPLEGDTIVTQILPLPLPPIPT